MNGEEFLEVLRTGDAARASALLQDDPRLASARDGSGLSAVTWALYNRKTELVELLLRHRPPLDVFEAAALGRTGEIEVCLAQEPQAVRAWSADGFTPLHLAAFFAHPAAARLLVDRGADVRAIARNPSCVEPLHSAAAAGQLEIVELLLHGGADPNARQHGGFTPLHSAAMQGNAPLARALVARGADPDLRADDGRSARDMAGGRTEVVAALGTSSPP